MLKKSFVKNFFSLEVVFFSMSNCINNYRYVEITYHCDVNGDFKDRQKNHLPPAQYFGVSQARLPDLQPEQFGHIWTRIFPLGRHFRGQINKVAPLKGVNCLFQFHL